MPNQNSEAQPIFIPLRPLPTNYTVHAPDPRADENLARQRQQDFALAHHIQEGGDYAR